MKNPTIVSAVICEDIRQEISGKFSLAGVFGAGIDIITLPAVAVVGVFGEVKFPEMGTTETQYRIVDSGGDELVRGSLTVNVQTLDSAPLVLGPFQVRIVRDGEVRVEWKSDDADWMTVRSFRIRHSPRRAPAAANPI
jgi:hypothetical protein